ncbi:MAG: type VI secretion system lipoprotein TssJ, partial [Oleibacter sp.]|nr:type VI secretion system lipoprotein TssJ [Thalassolituus sp.]
MFCTIVLTACVSTSTEKTVDFSYTICADSGINPDINGDASSIVVQVFQLANSGNYEAALYEELFNGDVSVLGSELLAVSRHLIDPGTSQTFNTEISANTKFIGVAAGYREIDLVTWKVIEPVAEESLLDSVNVFRDRGMTISVTP